MLSLQILRGFDGSPQPASKRCGAKSTGWARRCPAERREGRHRSDPLSFIGCSMTDPDGRDSHMWYAIEGYDAPQSLEQRVQARPAHLARLVALKDAGRLLLAGPCPAIDAEDPGPAGFSGSIVIAEFDSLAAARAWADADPYVDAGVYLRVEVRPFRAVLP
jgi:uncharacterized protein YciI